jgi:hypothetical protein
VESKTAREVIASVEFIVTDNDRLEALKTWQSKLGPFSADETTALVSLFGSDSGRGKALQTV